MKIRIQNLVLAGLLFCSCGTNSRDAVDNSLQQDSKADQSQSSLLPDESIGVMDRNGYLHGWKGKVRYYGGHWGYLRGRNWYWYDRFFDPEYYFANSLRSFSKYRRILFRPEVANAQAGASTISKKVAGIYQSWSSWRSREMRAVEPGQRWTVFSQDELK